MDRFRRPQRTPGAPIVEPRPAATLVLLRPGPRGLEVLLTRRARALRFGGDMHVFPGGRLDPADSDHAAAAVRETAEETGIVVPADDLIELTRWVTPPGLPARFDARFFAAIVPAGTEVSAGSDEVADATWVTPSEALRAAARGDLAMWLPTFVTLQQLDGLADREAIARAFGDAVEDPARPPRPPRLEVVADGLFRLDQPWAAGIVDRRAAGWVVGRRKWVVVDPADPTGEVAAFLETEAVRSGAVLAGCALTDLDPVHHAGVEMFATGRGLPVVAGRGAAAMAPYPLEELGHGARVPFGDVEVVAQTSPSPARSEALRYSVGGRVLAD